MNDRSKHGLDAGFSRFQSGVLIGITLLLLAIIVAAIAYAYQTTARSLLLEQQRTLTALTEMQVAAIRDRMRNRLRIAETVANDLRLRGKLTLLDTPGSYDVTEIREQLIQYQNMFRLYNLELYDAQGRRITGTMTPGNMPPDLPRWVHRALETDKPIIFPVWRAPDSHYVTSMIIPFSEPRAGKPPVHAVLVISSKLLEALYADLASATRHSNSADIFVMRQQQDKSWLITSPQRDTSIPPLTTHLPDGAYDFAIPADENSEPNIGVDHKGTPVLAVKQPITIPEAEIMPAVLVAKIDRSTILANARAMTALTMAVVGLAFMLACAIAVAAHQRNRRRASQRLLAQANALGRAEARFRATFEQAAVGIAHITFDNRLLRVNNRLCAMLGYSREEMEGSVCLNFLAPASKERVFAMRRELEAGNVPFISREELYTRKDGSPIWIDCTTSLAHDAHGKPDYFIQVFQDVSGRRAQEQALRESQQRFELAVRGTEEGVWDWDRKTLHLYLSPRCRVLLGLGDTTPVDLLLFWSSFIHPQDRQIFRKAWSRLRRNQSSLFECELRLRKGGADNKDEADYREYWIRGYASRDENGALERIVGLLADITERKQTVRRLRLAGTVFANSREGIVVTDLTGNVSTVNPSFTRITGYEEKDIIGQNMRMMHSGRHDRSFYVKMWRAILRHGNWVGEIWNRRKDGVVILEHLSISTVYDADGHPQNYVGSFHDITQIKRSEQALDHMAHFDPLTDLPNRTLLTSLVDHAVNRQDARCAVLCVDLDRFKTINESFGHLAGDQVLRISAERMRSVLAPDAMLGRYGADEFVVLLENVERPRQACEVAAQIISALGAPYILGEGVEAYVGASVGISLFPEDATSAQDLMQHANSALSEAKANGRGSYSVYTQALTQDAKTRVTLERDLRRALARDEFVLHFQPVIELTSGKIRCMEALVRWQSPTQGLVMPGHFIPRAEETGLIMPLGDWVLEESCRQMATWMRAGNICDYIAVNLSPRQFNRENLCQLIAQVLENTGLPPERLEIEITESALFDSRADAEKKCERLHAMGVRLALDDFGTGYSSLGYLKRFPISKLKIDRSFVNDLPRSVADSKIADAIISVARALGLEVVAEGIETEEQYRFLNAHGCDMGQGFLFSKPLPVNLLEELVELGLPFKPR